MYNLRKPEGGQAGNTSDLPEFGGIVLEKIGPEGGAYVKKIRLDVFKMTQEAFAGLIGVSISTLRAWEAGTNAVPRYVLTAVRIMASDPETALRELGVGVCMQDGDTNLDWDSGAVRFRGMSTRRCEDAVNWMKRAPERERAMEIIDGLMEFESHYRDLGYPKLSSTELLLLYLCVSADRIREMMGKG